MLSRRYLLAATTGLVAAGALAVCTTPSQQATFDQAKAYFTGTASAIEAAASVYLASTPGPSAANVAIVQTGMQVLHQAQESAATFTDPATLKAGVIEALGVMQQLAPMVAPFLGAAGPFVPMGIAVVQAFVNSLPVPPNTPAVPPASLSRAGVVRH